MGSVGEDSVSHQPSVCNADCLATGACTASACAAAGGCTAVGGCQDKPAPVSASPTVQELQADLIQIALLGSENVGKTALIQKLVHGEQLQEHKPTEYDVCIHHMKVGGKDVTLKIGDAGGAPTNSTAMDKNIMESSGFILVYDITNKDTFEELQKIRTKVINMKQPQKDIPMVIVGNKSDLNPQRVVLSKQGQALGKTMKCPFFETSIMTGENINEAFQALHSEIQQKATRPSVGGEKGAKKGCCTLL